MNKFKKLTLAAVSTVMAGTMALSFTACNNKPGKPEEKPDYAGKDYYGILKDDGSINYDAYKRDSEVTLNLAVGHDKLVTSTSYADLGDEITMPDGVTYSQGNMKPAWVQMGKDLNIKWNDMWDGSKTSDNLKNLTGTTDETTGKTKYSMVDMFTTDLSKAVEYANKGTSILNLADYLDYMPNLRNFLNENPVVYLSLLQDGMDTETGEDQVIYVAPYFDGNDDIERYNLMRQDFVEKLLNGNTSTASTETLGVATKVEPYFTADYTIESLNKAGNATIKIKKNYTAALAAAKDDSTDLGKAYKAIAGAAYNGTSGNIVAIMNAALAAKADATGAQLVDLFRAYIDVCYQDENGNAHFSADDRANLFIGYDACWDVDDLVAILRCVKTNGSLLVGSGKTVGGIMPRSGQNDRTPDMVRLACQLYGVRGADSRLEYTYIAKDGTIKDARATKDIYEACANLNLLKQEGLVADYSMVDKFSGSGGIVSVNNVDYEYFMEYDYSQTQTLNGFYVEDDEVTGVDLPSNYKFGAVITPVAKWDVDGDGNHTDIMRFTESWRSTKTGGLALNGDLAKTENKAKLDAALQFVDYLYSEDGQIVSTYGPMAENADGKGGFWYNEEANDAQVKAGNYFRYKGVRYAGTDYKGRTTPTITAKVYDSFKGKEVNGWKVTSNSKVTKGKLSFTNYARYLIGSTLPVGVKDQSFENQLTSEMGKKGANIVGTALAAGVVKGMSLKLDPNNYWYTCVPTGLPTSTTGQTTLDSQEHKNFMYLTGTAKASGDKNFFSIFNTIVLNGYGSHDWQEVTFTYTNVNDLLTQTLGQTLNVQQTAATRQNIYNQAWTTAKSYWTYLESVAKGNAD